MSTKKRITQPPENIFVFSKTLKSAIKANQFIQLIYWRMQGKRKTHTDTYIPIGISAGLLPSYLKQEVYKEYRRSSQFHESNQAVFRAQYLYLTLYLKNKTAPPNKKKADEIYGYLWSKYGTNSGLDQKAFSHYIWRVTKKRHLVLFAEPLPQQIHLLYGRVDKDKGKKKVWLWTDLAVNEETGRIEPVRVDFELLLT